jgi:hypothetical protein
VAALCAEGLAAESVSVPPGYRYQPASAELIALVNRLTAFYAKHIVPVTNLIHSKPKSRIQEFADAFRLKQKEE